MSKVYVVNRGGHNHDDAKRFGELIYLSEGAMSRYAVTNIYRQFTEVLKDSSQNDYILVTGLTVMCCVACSIFARKHGSLNLLLHTPSKGGIYVERSVMLDELLRKED